MSLERCEVCGGADVTYAAFSGGREYWCGICESNHPYPEEQLPPRLKLLREGRMDELRAELRELPQPESRTGIPEFYRWLSEESPCGREEDDE